MTDFNYAIITKWLLMTRCVGEIPREAIWRADWIQFEVVFHIYYRNTSIGSITIESYQIEILGTFFKYWDLPTTKTWAISEPLMHHGTVLMYSGTMSQAVRLGTQSSLGIVRSSYGI